MTAPIVIVGAGQAATKAIEALRKHSCRQEITLIGEECELPYQRPPLSKKFLSGEVTKEQLWLQSKTFFDKYAVEFRSGTRATDIDVGGRVVQLENGATLAYNKLLLTTGSRPRTLGLPGSQLAGVHSLHKMSDVAGIRSSLAHGAEKIVIIGGGYIGLEVAATLTTAANSVTILETRERLLARVVNPVVSDYFLKLHTNRGVAIRLNAAVEKIAGTDKVTGVALMDGTMIDADLVLIAIGSVANEDIATKAGLPCQGGIVVDAACRVTDNIYAAGDCTRFPSQRYQANVRLESVQNANDQARAAAKSITGSDVQYDPVPWFWSDQFETKLQIAGLSQGYDRVSVEGNPDDGSFAVSYWREDRLLAVDAINAPRAFMHARRTLEQSTNTIAESRQRGSPNK